MLFSVQGVIFFRTQLAFKKVQFLTINVVWWVCKHNLNRQKKTAMHFLFFIYTILTWKFKYITYINKLYYIYKQVFLGHLGCTVFIQDSFLFIHAHIYTCMHMHTPTHLHARMMHTLHVKKSHSASLENHPNRLLCGLLLLHHVFVRFVYYFMQSKTPRSLSLHSNSPFPLSWKSSVICWQSVRNYSKKPYIGKKCMLSAVRSNQNYMMLQTVEELW